MTGWPRALALAAALWGAAPAGAGEGEAVAPGSYCPLPTRGEVPKCLEPARSTYAGFFDALEHGEPSDAAVAELESDVARGGASERAYLALSSLAYGYYRLTQVAAASPGEDPTIVARLERWNELLSGAYASSDDPAYRQAVQSAARDLRARSDIELSCVDASGERVACRSTEAVLRGLDQASGQMGARGAVQRLLERVFGGDDS
jgi:hypothetical protein